MIIFKLNQITSGNTLNKKLLKIDNQPPKNKIDESALINNIFAYSLKKKEQKSSLNILHYIQKLILLLLPVNQKDVC